MKINNSNPLINENYRTEIKNESNSNNQTTIKDSIELTGNAPLKIQPRPNQFTGNAPNTPIFGHNNSSQARMQPRPNQFTGDAPNTPIFGHALENKRNHYDPTLPVDNIGNPLQIGSLPFYETTPSAPAEQNKPQSIEEQIFNEKGTYYISEGEFLSNYSGNTAKQPASKEMNSDPIIDQHLYGSSDYADYIGAGNPTGQVIEYSNPVPHTTNTSKPENFGSSNSTPTEYDIISGNYEETMWG